MVFVGLELFVQSMITARNTKVSLKLASIAQLIVLFVALPSFAAAGTLNEGLRQFSAGRYTAAAGHFEHLTMRRPNDPMARYYLASCYVHLNRHEDAIREYENCFRIDPFGPVSGYCRQALLAYGRPLPSDIEKNAMRQPQQVASALPDDRTSNPLVSQAVTNIRRQATQEKGRHRDNAESMAVHVQSATESQIRRIRDEANRRVKEILETPLVPNYRLGMGIGLAALEQERQRRDAEVAQIRAKAEEDCRRVQTDAEDQAQRYRRHAQDRQASLDETAESLESQIASTRPKDKVRLRAEGTGLYVRYYGTSSSPAPEVRNSVVRIRRHGDEPPAADVQDGEAPKEPMPVKSVSGTVLK